MEVVLQVARFYYLEGATSSSFISAVDQDNDALRALALEHSAKTFTKIILKGDALSNDWIMAIISCERTWGTNNSSNSNDNNHSINNNSNNNNPSLCHIYSYLVRVSIASLCLHLYGCVHTTKKRSGWLCFCYFSPPAEWWKYSLCSAHFHVEIRVACQLSCVNLIPCSRCNSRTGCSCRGSVSMLTPPPSPPVLVLVFNFDCGLSRLWFLVSIMVLTFDFVSVFGFSSFFRVWS